MNQNNNRIIGDFCEINADLIYQRVNSSSPKFISNYKYKKLHNKLIKSVDKLRKSNYILSKDNLLELFAYYYNTYPPYGNYKSVIFTKILDRDLSVIDAKKYEGAVKIDNCIAIISIDTNLDNFDIHLTVDNEESKDSFTVQLKELKSSNRRFNQIIDFINKNLLNDMCDFIIETLSAYDI